MKRILIIAIILLGITPVISSAYTVTPVGGTFDGDYLKINCSNIPNYPVENNYFYGVATSTEQGTNPETSSVPFYYISGGTGGLSEFCGLYSNNMAIPTSTFSGLPADNYFLITGVKDSLYPDWWESDFVYLEFTWDGTNITSYNYAEDTSTRFSYFAPAGGSTRASSTENTIYTDLYLNENDYISGNYVVLKYMRLEDLQSAVGSPDLLETRIVLNDTITSGLNALATTTGSFGADGKYILTAELHRPDAWYDGIVNFVSLGMFDNSLITSSSTIFTYGTTTAFEQTMEQWERDNEEFMASSTASANVKAYCSFDTSFSLGLCISALFVPTKADMYLSLTDLKNGIGSRFPLGYLTDFASILATTSTSTLTVLHATVPSALGLGTPEITLSLNHVLDPVLNATTSVFNTAEASSTETFYEITVYYWKILVYLGTLFYILGRIVGGGIVPMLPMSSTEQMNKHKGRGFAVTQDEYALKEWLYKHKK